MFNDIYKNGGTVMPVRYPKHFG